MERVTLDDIELARLQRILAVDNLERERWFAYPFWAMAAILHIVGFAMVAMGHVASGFVVVAFGFATLMIGMARYGYYRMFRMLHYMASTGGRIEGNITDGRLHD